ncbi:PD-(D/E)XK nuclease family protein [Persephonella sp. KM09-Lau-8]|uniref:PD-(D/E)XK nuclease family protein n=1 Tax=Persephonella sp. KM09-Lau-8 TaxID=1158345 RepID=UPI0004965802|nr:PD-(D/E)XK nuclease family protein [Persephonella sp. KM09-Lau-8]
MKERFFCGSYSYLKEKLSEIIIQINKNQPGSKLTFIVHSNQMKQAFKEYLTDKAGILVNAKFYTPIDIAKEIAEVEPIQNFEKQLILKKIMFDNGFELEGLVEEYGLLTQQIKEYEISTGKINNPVVRKIVQDYINLTGKEIIDREDTHKIATSKDTNFQTDYLFIIGIKSVAPIHQKLFKKLKKLSKEIFVFLPFFFDSGYYENHDHFKTLRAFYEELSETPPEIEKTDNPNVKTGKYVYRFFYEDLPVKNPDLQVYQATGIEEEVEYVAIDIVGKLLDRVQPHQIGVIIPDIQKYIPQLKETFRKYNIPYYLFEENRFIDDPIYSRLFGIFQIKLQEFSKESVLKVLSPELLGLPDLDSLYLKILQENNLNSYQDWESFVFEGNNSPLKELLKILDLLPEQANIKEFVRYFEEIKDRYITCEKCKEFLENIFEFLLENRIYSEFFSEISYKEFVSIVETFFNQENKENRKKGDFVSVLTPSAAEGNNFKYIYFLNLNSGVYPSPLREEILATASELGMDYPFHVLMQELANFAAILDKGKQIKLFYTATDTEKRSLYPSVFVNEVIRITEKEPEKIQVQPILYTDFVLHNGDKLASPVSYELTKENFIYDFVNIKKPISPTGFAVYVNCPYKYFWDVIIGVAQEEIDRRQIPAYETGKFIHDILYRYYKGQITTQQIEKEFEEFFEKQKRFLIPAYIPVEYTRIKLLKEKTIDFIKKDELRMKENGIKIDLELLEKELSNGIFKGRIDRAEKDPEGFYYIADYKTGNVKELHKTFEKELKKKYIQLLIYKKLLEQEGKQIKNVAIFAINDHTKKYFYFGENLDFTALEEYLDEMVNQLFSKKFHPEQNDECRYCPYHTFCLKDDIQEQEDA